MFYDKKERGKMNAGLILYCLTLLCAYGHGADMFEGALEVAGTFKAVNQTTIGYALRIGTLDAFSRSEMWLLATNDADPANAAGTYAGRGGVVHLGACTADGFPFNIISEGLTIWGQNEFGGEMNGANWSLARLKPGRFQLRQSVNGVQEDLFRADPNKIVWRDTFEVSVNETTVSNLLVLEGDGSNVMEVPQDDTPIHLTDNSLGRIPIVVDGVTRYIPYFA